jgi:hypothetical protein
MFLFVRNGVPPDIQQLISPSTSAYEERPEVEARAVLRENEVHGVDISIAHSGTRLVIKIIISNGVGDIQRVVLVDVAVNMPLEMVE